MKINWLELLRRKKEFEAFATIMNLSNPESRWQVLNLWLAEKGDWQQTIKECLDSDDSQIVPILCRALNIDENALALFDANGAVRQKAVEQVKAVKALFLARQALDLPPNA